MTDMRTLTTTRPNNQQNLRRKLKDVFYGFLTTLSRVDRDLQGEVKCPEKHKVRKVRSPTNTMSVVGCFGDCGFGPTEAPKPRQYKLVFHPPIQTILKEKDTQKWYTDMVNELATLGDDPNTFNEFGEAPLCVAAYKAQGMVVEELLQRENIKVGREESVRCSNVASVGRSISR